MRPGRLSPPQVRWEYLSESGAKLLARSAALPPAGSAPPACRFHAEEAGLCRRGRLLRTLAAMGIAVSEPLGFGLRGGAGAPREEVLLTKAVAGAGPLDAFLVERYPQLLPREKRRTVQAFGAFVRSLHDSGVFCRDLRPEHVLVVASGGQTDFFLNGRGRISLPGRGLSDEERAISLAALLAATLLQHGRFERFRFLTGYFTPGALAQKRALLVTLEQRGLKLALRDWNRRTRLSMGNNEAFVDEFRSGFRILHPRTLLAEEALLALLPDPDRAFEQAEIFKPGSRTHAGMVTLAGRRYFLKRYNCRGWLYRLQNAFRRSRALRTWRTTWGFVVRGLPVPRPLLCLEERRCRLLGRSYILMEFAAESGQLNDLWPLLEERRRRHLLVRLGLLLGRMHRCGCLHGDLKWSNILVGKEPAAEGQIRLVDLDGSRLLRRVSVARMVSDLQRFLKDLTVQGRPKELECFVESWRRWTGGLGGRASRVGVKKAGANHGQ